MYIFQPERDLLRKQVKSYSEYIKGRVLDVGAGEGDRYGDFFDCDEYVRMDTHKGADIDIVGRAEDIPLDNESVDSVVCTQVFEHLKYPEKSAKEIYRILKNGGHLLITVPQMNELHEEPNDFFRYTKYGMFSLFNDVGFETVTYNQRGGFFTTKAQIGIRYLIDRFKLYEKPFAGRLLGKFILLYGKFMMWLDTIDKSEANRKHTLGWCMVFRK